MPRFFMRNDFIVNLIVLTLLALALLGLLYVTGLLRYVPLLNRLAPRDVIIITPLPGKVIQGHGTPPPRH